MTKILSILMVLVLSFSSASALSTSDAGYNDLTAQQQAEVLKVIADKKLETQADPEAVVDKAQKWVDLGASIGKGLASSAKELGIAVNDFAKTDVGKWTMYLIIFNIAGGAIIHVFGGILFMIAGFTFTTIMLNRFNGMLIEYDKDTGKIKSKTRQRIAGEDSSGFLISYFIVALIGIVIIFSY